MGPFDVLWLVPVPAFIVLVLAVAAVVAIVVAVGNHDQ